MSVTVGPADLGQLLTRYAFVERDPSKRDEIAALVAERIGQLSPQQRPGLVAQLSREQRVVLGRVQATESFQRIVKNRFASDPGFAAFLAAAGAEAPAGTEKLAEMSATRAKEQAQLSRKERKEKKQVVSRIQDALAKLRGPVSSAEREALVGSIEKSLATLPAGSSRRRALAAKLEQLRSTLVKAEIEHEGMQRPEVREAQAHLEGEPTTLAQGQKSALDALANGLESPEARAVIAGLPEGEQARLRSDAAKAGAEREAIGGPEGALLAKLARGEKPTEADVAKSVEAATERGEGRLTWESLKTLPNELKPAAEEYLLGQDRVRDRANAIHLEIMSLLNSSLPIETVIVMVMALFGDLAEEKMRDKMREMAFAGQVERLEREGLKPGAHGFAVKKNDVLMQELQVLTQQWTQMTQALAAAMRLVQDMALTVIRNIH